MSGIFHSLNIGSEALYANRQGIDTTAHNIANAQTEGYSRQRVEISQRDPKLAHGVLLGDGVFVGTIDRMHDKFVEKQVNLALTDQGFSHARYQALMDLEAIYSPELQGSSIADELNNFYKTLHELSRYPEELSVRTAVREAGQNVADAFRRVDSHLRRHLEGLNDQLNLTTDEVNRNLESIAELNQKIREIEIGPRNQANDLRDQRDRQVRELGEKLNVHSYEDKDGMVTIHGPGDYLLVDRGHAASIKAQRSKENMTSLDLVIIPYEGGKASVVTDKLTSGQLSAMVQVRDKTTQVLIDQNNEMAASFVARINEIHRHGYGLDDFKDARGRDFFEPVESFEFAARDMQVSAGIIATTNAISVASTPSSSGDNVIVNALIRTQSEKIFQEGMASLGEYYADYVGILGSEVKNAKHVMEADKVILADLLSRREAVSGVSLDEEASNMIKWQTAFTASSKVITTIDEMLETILGLKR